MGQVVVSMLPTLEFPISMILTSHFLREILGRIWTFLDNNTNKVNKNMFQIVKNWLDWLRPMGYNSSHDMSLEL